AYNLFYMDSKFGDVEPLENVVNYLNEVPNFEETVPTTNLPVKQAVKSQALSDDTLTRWVEHVYGDRWECGSVRNHRRLAHAFLNPNLSCILGTFVFPARQIWSSHDHQRPKCNKTANQYF